MRSTGESLTIILESAPPPANVVHVPVSQAMGRVLARDAVADHDMPPFERSSMDGWAVRADDVSEPGARLRITGRIMAGDAPTGRVGAGETMKIMTGAPVPEGADAVVMVEQSEEHSSGEVVTLSAATRTGGNVCHQGEDLKAGETIVPAGTLLDASAVSLAALAGMDPVPTWAVPTVAVIPTGDELVDPGGPTPPLGMIRETNGVLMAAQVRAISPALQPVQPGIARDTRESVGAMLDVGMGHDVLCLSGGVSMGDLDIVRNVLDERGFDALVEKVAIKPGKPLVCGRLRDETGHECMVFGLPGNPVSTYVTFELFVRPYILRFMGLEDVLPDVVAARLLEGGRLHHNARTQYIPATVAAGEDGLVAAPVVWHGSGDMRGAADANAFIMLEAGTEPPRAGERVQAQLIAGRALRPVIARSRGADRG